MRSVLLPFIAVSLRLAAQTTADISSFMFSTGVHPTFAVAFDDTDAGTVNAFWKSELKGVSVKVADKKELIAIAARIPSISPDTIRLLVKADQPKGLRMVTAHVAVLTTSGFVGPDSPELELTAARAYVEQRSVVLKRQLAQSALEKGQKDLSRLQNDLDLLQREKTRSQEGITKNQRKDQEAQAEKAKAEEELVQLTSDVEAARQQVSATPTEEGEKQLKDKERQHAKAQERIRRAGDASVNAQKKVKDLEWSITRNVQDQAAKQQAIEKQEAVVEDLRQKLAAIR
jgi:hypothetical protein